MTQFNLDDALLSTLFATNNFKQPESCLVFIGIRGCLPASINDNSFLPQAALYLREVDYRNLRCTILQWNPVNKLIATFAASTVPHLNNILGYKEKPPRRSNCLTPGYYQHFRKGKHRPKKPQNWHDAFRQDQQPLAIRRTYDNTVYNNFDEIEVSVKCDDNIHAAWTLSEDSATFSSAGCQVVMGIPFCDATKDRQADNLGPWKTFKDNAYGTPQDHFPYALFEAPEVYKLATRPDEVISARMKFGSSGEWVKELQEKLRNLNYLSGIIDGEFGTDTFNAVKAFQMNKFGKEDVDGVVGPLTVAALGISTKTISL